MIFSAVNARISVSYNLSDTYRSICRINPSAFVSLNAKVGSVARIKIIENDTTNDCEVLCTLWPSEYIQEAKMIIDTTVVLQGFIHRNWTEATCTILLIHPYQVCSSLHVTQTRTMLNHENTLQIANMIGLPVSIDCKIYLSGHQPVEVSRINCPGEYAVVSSNTVLIRSSPTHSSRDDKVDSSHEVFSNIRVVDELIDRIVYPAAYLPSYVQFKGVMLLGPPGVGKTYAVKAVRHICKKWCKIHLLELNIPTLLAESNPLRRLELVLSTIDRMRKRIRKKDNNDDSVGRSTNTNSNVMSQSNSEILKTPLKSSSMSSMRSMTSQSRSVLRTPITYTPGVKTIVTTPKNDNSSSSGGGGGGGSGAVTNSAMKFSHRSPSPGFGAFTSTMKSNSSASKSKNPSVSSTLHECDENEPNNNSSTQYFPELVFLVMDEVDALGKGGAQSELQTVIKSRLCHWLDGLNGEEVKARHAGSVRCCVLATSNRSEDIDLCFRRGGRLEHEIVVLTSQQDRQILLTSLLFTSFLLSTSLSTEEITTAADASTFNEIVLTKVATVIAERTGGYVAADLVALVREMHLVHSKSLVLPKDISVFDEKRQLEILLGYYDAANRLVPPSCLRGVSIQLPNINYSDVIGYEEIKLNLRRVLSFSSPDMRDKIRRFGLSAPGGVLLHGPPGNSKTRLVMAAAAHHGLPVISLSSADIFSPYVGDAEAEIRKAFRTARQARPCVLFIDELDSIVTNRETGGNSSAGVEGRVLATLLTEMDGIQGDDDRSSTDPRGGGSSNSGGVIVLGATNRLDFIDAALIRKGRFHHVLHVPLPNRTERGLILEYFAAKCHLSSDIVKSLKLTVSDNDGLSGADIENICREEVLRQFRSH